MLVENDTSDEYVCTIAPKKQLEKEPVGVEYPSDLWLESAVAIINDILTRLILRYLIGAYVYPESVGKFASLCRASARVLQSPGFWRRLHSRYGHIANRMCK